MSKYLDYIEEQIAYHGTELEKHMNAREILLRMEKKQIGAGGVITISGQLASPPQGKTKKPRKTPVIDHGSWQRVRDAVMTELATESMPMTSSEIINRMINKYGEEPGKKTRDRVHGILKDQRSRNTIILENHLYRLGTAA